MKGASGQSGTRSEAKATGDPEELQKGPARPTWWLQPCELTPDCERVAGVSVRNACGFPRVHRRRRHARLSTPQGTFTGHFYAGSYTHGQTQFFLPQTRFEAPSLCHRTCCSL